MFSCISRIIECFRSSDALTQVIEPGQYTEERFERAIAGMEKRPEFFGLGMWRRPDHLSWQ